MNLFDKVFGVDEKRYVASKKERPKDYGQVEYMGGHKMFPAPMWTLLYFYEDRFELDGYDIKVYYSKIKDITNSNEMKREAEHFMLAGLAGYAFWKKNHVYTLIEYDDGVDTQKIVIDFRNNVNYAQALIYKKMLECRKNSESQKVEKSSSDSANLSTSGSPFKF